MEYRIGIDPGITGAIALLQYTGEWPKLVEVLDLPTMPLGKGKVHSQQINGSELTKILRKWIFSAYAHDLRGVNTTVYLEQVHTMPGQGVSSQGNFMMSYGIIQGAVLALGLPLILVQPNAWKKRAKLAGKDKDPDTARTLAQQMFPEASLARKKDIGRADAILIAVYGK
jgi:crossover junction endodeoxyribonuclease RuvC